jgi:hypothetical protein
MLPDYDDIRSLIDREPDWFDTHGVPRYRPFEPKMLGVYDQWTLLVEIACQECGQRFLVGGGSESFELANRGIELTLEYVAATFHYGDPPRHDCVGDTMNCLEVRKVEAWRKYWTQDNGWSEWQRDAAAEAIEFIHDCVYEGPPTS